LCFAVFSFYQPQLNSKGVTTLKAEAKKSLLLLAVSAVVLQLSPSLAILFYLAFVVYLSVRLYDMLASDNTEGTMPIVGCFNILMFAALVVILMYTSPLIFSNLRIFYILTVWAVITTAVVTLVSCYVTGVKKVSFYVDAAFLGWIGNTILCYAFLYGRGEMAVVYRLVTIHGHFPAVFVFLPIASLLIAHAAAAGGAAAFLTAVRSAEITARRKKETVPPKDSPKLLRDKADVPSLPSNDDSSQ